MGSIAFCWGHVPQRFGQNKCAETKRSLHEQKCVLGITQSVRSFERCSLSADHQTSCLILDTCFWRCAVLGHLAKMLPTCSWSWLMVTCEAPSAPKCWENSNSRVRWFYIYWAAPGSTSVATACRNLVCLQRQIVCDLHQHIRNYAPRGNKRVLRQQTPCSASTHRRCVNWSCRVIGHQSLPFDTDPISPIHLFHCIYRRLKTVVDHCAFRDCVKRTCSERVFKTLWDCFLDRHYSAYFFEITN